MTSLNDKRTTANLPWIQPKDLQQKIAPLARTVCLMIKDIVYSMILHHPSMVSHGGQQQFCLLNKQIMQFSELGLLLALLNPPAISFVFRFKTSILSLQHTMVNPDQVFTCCP